MTELAENPIGHSLGNRARRRVFGAGDRNQSFDAAVRVIADLLVAFQDRPAIGPDHRRHDPAMDERHVLRGE